jgi:hypothetical protein
MTSGSEAIQSTLGVDFPLQEIDTRRVAAAKRIIESGTSKVYKPTRSGFSTSAIIAAINSGKKILVIAPTNRILEETVLKASFGTSVQILPNCFCLRRREQVEQDRFLTQLPFPLPKCENCSNYKHCPVTKILDLDCPVIGITYHKLEALMLSKSKVAREILARLSHVDVVLLDEAHTISLPTVVRVIVFSEIDLPDGYTNLSKILSKWSELNENTSAKINQIREEANKGHVGRHLSKGFPNNYSLDFKQTVAAWQELQDLAIRRKELGISDKHILTLRDMVLLISSYHLTITYVKEKDGTEGRVYLTGNYWTSISALSRFLQDHVPNANHIYVSGTLVEPYPQFFSGLSGKEVNDAVFPDLNNTNDKMRIYPDTRRLGARNFKNSLPRIIERIAEIIKENPGKDVFIVAPNARKAKTIQKELIKAIGPAAPLVDYYRSDETMGVENSARICIAIGLAELPSNTYDHQAWGGNEEERWIDSRRLRQESVDAATWQTLSRVKDPDGKEESKVYCIGVREDRIRSVASWGPGRRLELKGIKEYRLPDGTHGKTPIFRTTVKELIKPPKICSGKKTGAAREGLNVGERVLSVENYDPTLIIFEFENILPIINNRQNLNKLGIYNNPHDDFEVVCSSAVLTSLLAARFDCFGAQSYEPDEAGRYDYRKHLTSQRWLPVTMKRHIRGEITIGLYQISLEDTVKWICFDIDDHEGERGAEAVRTEVRKLLVVLNKYGIPFLLEASGSPNSYHVWVLLKPTKTHNAHRFSRQIKSEAGIDCEVFPKQKSLNKDSKYGNLVKVPLGINRKTGVKSQFLDPKTFEPYMGVVPIPGIISLRDIDEREEATGIEGKGKRTKQNREKAIRTPTRLGQDLRPCMKALLESSTLLEGSEGHIMRVAIAAEARNIGLTIEPAIELFRDQSDFKVEITRKHIDYIYREGYHPYSCSKLRDQCRSLVKPYCAGCTWSNG